MFKLFLLFIAYLFVEIWLLLEAADFMGWGLVFLWFIGTTIWGLSRLRGAAMNMVKLQSAQGAPKTLAARSGDSLSDMASGFLLIIPGFFTDWLGVLLMLQPVRSFIAKTAMSAAERNKDALFARFSKMQGMKGQNPFGGSGFNGASGFGGGSGFSGAYYYKDASGKQGFGQFGGAANQEDEIIDAEATVVDLDAPKLKDVTPKKPIEHKDS